MTLEIGGLLYNRYRIESVIAQGGMGSIYKAIDQSLGVRVAVKENLFVTEESSRQFRREATILASLRHPNLPRVTDHFVIPDQGQYLVMDFIEGEDLRQRISRNSLLQEDEAILIGAAICDALSYLHNRPAPILHRDIKPGNVKVSPTGQVFLVDFGLARIAQPGQSTTIGAQALTPGYAPPEQYGRGTDNRSDIYSLGATLYAAMTGAVPEDGLSRAMGNINLTPLRAHNPNIPDQIASVIQKAMAVQQNDRYQSADQFKTALLAANSAARRNTVRGGEARSALKQERTSIRSFPNSQQVTQEKIAQPIEQIPVNLAPVQQRKKTFPWFAVLAGIIALAIICLLVFAYFISDRIGINLPFVVAHSLTATTTHTQLMTATQRPAATQQPTETIEPTQPATPVPTATLQIPLPTPELPSLTPSPVATAIGGGRGKIAFVSKQMDGLPQIWIMNVDGSKQKQITNLKDGACQPDWSPDGTRLVIISPCRNRQDLYKGSSLFLMNADGTGLTPLASSPGGDFEPAWSPDGKRIAFTSIRTNNIPYIYLYDLQTNLASRVTKTSTNERHPAWSLDGKYLAFDSTRLGTSQVWVMNSNGTDPREFSTLANGVSFKPDFSPVGATICFLQGSKLPWIVVKQFPADSTTQEFTISDFRPVIDVHYSKDGNWLVFAGQKDSNFDIFILTSVTGANLTRLTSEQAEDFNPVWQP